MPRRLLLADDDPSQIQLALHLIRSLDFEVYAVSDGREALEQIRRHHIQLAVLDWGMPGMNGVEVCRKLQELPWSVYAIILTAHSTQEDLASALEAGASDYLAKPFNPNELRARLRVAARILSLQERATHTQKMESIGQLAAGIAHEINTPAQFVSDNLRFLQDMLAGLLRTVDVQLELLARVRRGEPVESELIEKVECVLSEADLEYGRKEIPMALSQSIDGIDRVAKIVQAMKKFSHPGSAQCTLVDLNESLESTLTVSRGEWKLVADVELDLDPELPEIECMPGEINQVMLNLIVNAAQAIAEVGANGGAKGRIGVSTRREGERVRIDISDSGRGIAPENRRRIFEPFFTTKEVGKGTGQGLALAYEVIVRQHGGTIEFESALGQGTTFTIRLPIAPKPEPTPPRPAG